VAYGKNNTVEEGLKPGDEAISPKEAIVTRQFWLIFIMFFSFGFCTFATQIHIAPHATDLGIPLTRASSILLVMGLVSMIVRVIMGYMADRIGNKWAFAIGFALVLAGILLLMPAREMWQFWLFASVFGLGHGDCDTQLSPIVAMLFGLTSHGLIFGLVNMGFTLGAAVGPLVAGYIFDVTNSYQIAFLVSAALAGVGLISALLLKPIEKSRE
jgi:MFS family permease